MNPKIKQLVSDADFKDAAPYVSVRGELWDTGQGMS